MKKMIIITLFILLSFGGNAWTDEWAPIVPPNSPTVREGHGMLTLPDGRVMLFGGEDAEGNLFDDLHAFEEEGWNRVTPANAPPPARRDYGAWVYDEVMYIYGGQGTGGVLNDTWKYSPTANTWTEIPDAGGDRPVARQGHTCTATSDGGALILGGKDAAGNYLNELWRRNTDNTYMKLKPPGYHLSNHCANLVENERLIVIGKFGFVGIYNISTNEWKVIPGGPPVSGYARSVQIVNAAGENIIFIFGGLDGYGNQSSAVYEYNVLTGVTTQRESMPYPVVNGGAAVLPIPPASAKLEPGILNSTPFGATPTEELRMLFFGGLTDGVVTNNNLLFDYVPAEALGIIDSGDYDGDGTSDIAVYRGSSGLWAVRGVTRSYFGSSSDQPVSGDYNGDGTAEIGIFRGSSGLWAIKGVTRTYFGSSSDTAVPLRFNPSSACEIGIFREALGLWAVKGVTRVYFGATDDLPVPGDYDGDGTKEFGVFRGSSGLWALRGVSRVYFGNAIDEVVPGDYDGDSTWETGIFRSSSGLWAIRGVTKSYFGSSLDKPVPADYTGTGIDSIGIFRSSSGLWAVSGVTRIYFGGSSDIPVTR